MNDKLFMNGAVSLVGTFSIAAGTLSTVGVTPEERAHNEAVSSMTQYSIQRCAPTDNPLPYYSRLAYALEAQSTETLNTLRNNNIAVCLDARLPHQLSQPVEGQHAPRVDAIYYGKERVLSIADNGREFVHDKYNWWQNNPAFNSSSKVRGLAQRLDEGEIKQDQTYFLDSWRTASKHSRTVTGAYTEADLPERRPDLAEHVRNNSWLRNPPEAMIKPEVRPIASVSTTLSF